MINEYIEGKTFSNKNFTKQRLPIAEYDQCVFKDCTFEQGDLSNCTFLESEFINCNLIPITSPINQYKSVLFNLYFVKNK